MKGRFFRKPRPVLQHALPLEKPVQPNEELRMAFIDADLHRAGLDFAKVLLHQRAAKLLANMVKAKQRGLRITAHNYARQLLTIKGELK